MATPSTGYENLRRSDETDQYQLDTTFEIETLSWKARKSKPRNSSRTGLLLSVNAIFLASIMVIVALNTRYLCLDSQVIYSPAQHIVKYETKVFKSSFPDDLTEFQGPPSEENNAAWDGLYDDFGLHRIPKSQARLLVNKTVPIPNDSGYYIVSLSVFHQLHCLNMIRKAYYSNIQYSPDDELMGVEHIDHCIDSLRQYLMCNADISPINWRWVEKDHKAYEIAQIAHSCKSWDAIKGWAVDNKLTVPFDDSVHVVDDI